MERQALEHQIELIIQNQIKIELKETIQEFRRNIRVVQRELNTKLSQITQRWERQIVDLEKNMKLLTTTTNVDKLRLIYQLNELTQNINNLSVGRANVHRQAKLISEELSEICMEISEFETSSLLPSEEDIHDQLLKLGPISFILPVIGQVTIRIEDYDQRSRQRKLPTSMELIEQVLTNFDISPYQQQIENISKDCYNSVNLMLNQEERIKQVEAKYQTIASSAVDFIEYLSNIGFRQSSDISSFLTALKNQIGLDVDVETSYDVGEAETSKDVLFAEIISLCDNPQNKSRLIEIGLQIGVNENDLKRMTSQEICNRLLKEFAL